MLQVVRMFVILQTFKCITLMPLENPLQNLPEKPLMKDEYILTLHF